MMNIPRCCTPRLCRTRLVHCNDYYNITEINIIRNRGSCNEITITMHLFGDDT